MYKRWAKVDQATGLIVAEGAGPDPDGALQTQLAETGFDVLEGRPEDVTGGTHFWDYALQQWAARPQVAPFSNPYDLTALPANTVVIVTDEGGAQTEITDLSDALTLVGPETYRVDIKPPAPYVKLRVTIEVS